MKNVKLVTNPTEKEKVNFSATELPSIARHMQLSKDTLVTYYVVGSRVSKEGKIYALSSDLMTCRERLAQFISSCAIAKTKIVDKVLNYKTLSYDINMRNTLYYGNIQMKRASNLIILARLYYPSIKDIKIENQRRRDIAEARAKMALRVLNDLEDQAGWKKTELFEVSFDDESLFKKNNFIGFLFSGSSNWFNSPYLVSIYSLIIRSTRHQIDNIEEIKNFETFIETHKKHPAKSWETASDQRIIRATAKAWPVVVCEAEKILFPSGRRIAYEKSMSPGCVMGWRQGISVLCENEASDTETQIRFKKRLAKVEKAW